MKSSAFWRWPVIHPIAAVVVSIAVSGCGTTPPRQAAAATEPPPGQAMISDGEEAFERALALAAAERHSEAREVLDPLLHREPDHTRAHLLHGVLRAHEGRVSHAIEIFETLRLEHPDLSEPYNNLAVLYAVEGRLGDAREILLELLERRPDAAAYANLREVNAMLAQDANDRAGAHDAGVVESPDPEAVPGAANSQASAGAAQTDPLADETQSEPPTMEPRRITWEPRVSAPRPPDEGETQSGQPAMEPRRIGWEPEVPVRGRPDSATESLDAAPVSGESAMTPSTMAPSAQAPTTESEDARDVTTGTVTTVSEEASIPGAFCADAGRFQSRRAVADAALWLQSFGADVIDVRREERRIPNSYRVYLPPFASRRQADAKLREIHDRGGARRRGHPGRRSCQRDFIRHLQGNGQCTPAGRRARGTRTPRPVASRG